jgi:hypothetical protein
MAHKESSFLFIKHYGKSLCCYVVVMNAVKYLQMGAEDGGNRRHGWAGNTVSAYIQKFSSREQHRLAHCCPIQFSTSIGLQM